MDYTDQNLENAGFQNLEINSTISSYLNETRKWTMFLAVLGFILVGFMTIVALFMLFIPTDSIMGQDMPFEMGLFGIVYFLIALLYFFPILYLARFSTYTKTALTVKDNHSLTVAFENLKSHYKFMGIFAIVILSIYALAIVVGAVAGIAGLFSNLV